MHEFGITRSVIEICEENSAGAAVKRVTIQIGKLSAIMPDAIRFCFDICAQGTVVEGAFLEILETPGRAKCADCSLEFEIQGLLDQCMCGSRRFRVIAGEELLVKELEV